MPSPRKPGPVGPQDAVAVIDRFRREEIGIRDCLDALAALIPQLPDRRRKLEALLKALEAIYAGAAEQDAYSDDEIEETEDLLDEMDEVLMG